MRRISLILLLVAFSLTGFAQVRGTLHLRQDPRVERLMKKQRDVYAKSNTMNGFRIQIFMEIGNEAIAHAEVVKRNFMEKFPELPIYLSYEQPNYRLRVGDFRNRVEAAKYLRLIKPYFNLAFVTADIINPPMQLTPVDMDASDDQGEENGENYGE